MEHRLTAIVHADVVGYSKLIAADESGTMQKLQSTMAVFRNGIEAAGGHVVSTAGDAILSLPTSLPARRPIASGPIFGSLPSQKRSERKFVWLLVFEPDQGPRQSG